MGRLCREDQSLQVTVEPCLADFSLKFQNVMFDIVPSSLFLFIAFFRIISLKGQRACHQNGNFLGLSKLVKLSSIAPPQSLTLSDHNSLDSLCRLGISRHMLQIRAAFVSTFCHCPVIAIGSLCCHRLVIMAGAWPVNSTKLPSSDLFTHHYTTKCRYSQSAEDQIVPTIHCLYLCSSSCFTIRAAYARVLR